MEKNESSIKEVSTVEKKLEKLIYGFLNDMEMLVEGDETKYFKNGVLNAFKIHNRKTRKMGMQILLKSFRKDLCVFFNSERNIVIQEYFREWNQRSERFPFFAPPPPPKIAKKSDFADTDFVDRVLDVMIKALRDARKDCSNDLMVGTLKKTPEQYNAKCKPEEMELKRLRYYHDTSIGLWCVDKNPKDVSYNWIVKNAFRLKDARYPNGYSGDFFSGKN